MKRTFDVKDDIDTSNLFIYRKILGYKPTINTPKGSREKEDIKNYIFECVSKDCAPKLLIKHGTKELEITCLITDIKQTDSVIYYYMINLFKDKGDGGLLILAVPTDHDSFSTTSLLCQGNKDRQYERFDPFSEETTRSFEEFSKKSGW